MKHYAKRTPEQKLRDAIDTLGDHYVCSKKNRVTRYPQHHLDSTETDVARTFARVRKANGLDLV